MGEADVLEDLDHAWIKSGPRGVKRALIPKYGSTLLPIHVARAVGAEGMVLTLPAACAAGNYAIGFGADLIRAGRADVVITGSAEIIQELQFSGFVRLAAMAPNRCQPFDLNRQGLIVGEGAGLLVLESEAHAVRRGARAQAEVGGYGLSCDAYHITRPHPEATGSIAAMMRAIESSGLRPEDVDFVNAHGTGTRANDVAEAKVMRDVFGGRRVPISSMKSLTGHCMGASSALEALGCVMTIETGIYPPTVAYETPDPECDLDVVANVARKGKADVVLNNSLAFGGYNAVTCFARPGVLPEPPRRAAAHAGGSVKPRALTGLGIVSTLGIGREPFFHAMEAPPLLARTPSAAGAVDAPRYPVETFDATKYPVADVAEVRGFDPAKYLGDKGLRTLDRLTKLLVVAARFAMHDAGFKKDNQYVQSSPDRIGVCCSNAYGSLEAITELDRVAQLEDARYINPAKFPNTVANSASGYVSIWEDLRALNVSVSDGNCGALDAVACADIYLDGGRADAILVGGGEAISEPLFVAFHKLGALVADHAPVVQGTRLGEGAAFLAMEPMELAQARGATIRAEVTGYGTSFVPPESEASLIHPSREAVERAMKSALADAGIQAAEVDIVASSVSGLSMFDRPEIEAIGRVFGAHTCVAAPKAILGETLGAGGGMGMAAALAWLNGAKPTALVQGAAPSTARTVLVSAMGFYGNASAVVLRRPA